MKTIEVYIITEEKIQPPPGGSYADYDAHPCWQKHNIHRSISSDQELALKILKKAAEQKNVSLKIYDVATFSGRLRALIKGVKAVPCTVVGSHKIEGIADPSKLAAIL